MPRKLDISGLKLGEGVMEMHNLREAVEATTNATTALLLAIEGAARLEVNFHEGSWSVQGLSWLARQAQDRAEEAEALAHNRKPRWRVAARNAA